MLIAKFLRYQLNIGRFLGLSDVPYYVHKNKILNDACNRWMGAMKATNEDKGQKEAIKTQ